MANRKFTDEQELIILGRLACGASTVQLAKEYGVARQTIASVKDRHPDFSANLTLKKEELAKSILDYMDSLKGVACDILDSLLAAMSDEEKINRASLSQIATALGILIDKFTKYEQPKTDDTAANNLLEAIAGVVKESDFDEVPPS